MLVPCETNTSTDALENAWQRIKTSGSQFAQPAYANAACEVVAKHIINMAQSGERDQRKLSDGAVQFLTTNYLATNYKD